MRKGLNFQKWIHRNDFTKIFGGIGLRRTIFNYAQRKPFRLKQRTKLDILRRSRQGWRNQLHSRMVSLKVHIKFGHKIGRRWWQK